MFTIHDLTEEDEKKIMEGIMEERKTGRFFFRPGPNFFDKKNKKEKEDKIESIYK